MKQAFLAPFFFLLATTIRAQDNKQTPQVSQLQQAPSVEQALRGMINPRGLQIANQTVLYRHLSDTISGHYARRLRPGDAVIIRSESARWLKVVRGTRDCINFSSDTATYYLPRSGAHGAKTFILI